MIIQEPTNGAGRIKRCLDKTIGIEKRCKVWNILRVVLHPIHWIIDNHNVSKLADYAFESRKLDRESVERWERLYKRYVCECERDLGRKVPDYFFGSDISRLKVGKSAGSFLTDEREPVVICALKDEITRVPAIMDYYRNMLGIKCFAMIDNCSTDGTLEYLKGQEDVILYNAPERYNSMQRTAWVCRVMEDLGINRWYLIIDADECFVYPEYEKYSLRSYVEELEKKDIKSVKGILLETYPKGDLFEGSSDGFIEKYCWVDPDSDEYVFKADTSEIVGGVHGRVFDMGWTARNVIKLMKPEGKRMPLSAHTMFPHAEDLMSPFGMIALHYKFLPGDMDKIQRIISEKNYANGSKFYRQYYKCFVELGKKSFWNENSIKWQGTESFVYFPMIQNLMLDLSKSV